MLNVELVYATHEQQKTLKLTMPEGSTIHEVILRSTILEFFPEIDLNQQKVGIFSKVRALTDQVQEGDRIEIYRPLLIDPKEARRARASNKIKKING